MFNNIKKRVLVIGAGYAGITLVNKLKDEESLEITLINESSYHLHQTDIHKYISGKKEFEDIAFDLYEYAKINSINFIKARVEDILFDKKEVLFENEGTRKYDYLVIAIGSKSFFPKQIENINEYAQDIKNINILKKKKEEFLKLVASNKTNKNIAIIGGGLSGVEIALEFAQVLKEKNINEDECKVSLIEQFPQILPNMNSFLVDKTTARCDELNIKRYHDAFVSKVENDKLYLSDGNEIEFDMSLFLIGVSSEELIKDEKVKTNIKNQFVVDEFLRLENHKNVFVIGDICETKDKNGNYNLPTAQMAKLQAGLTSKNILNTIQNKSLIKNKLETKGVMIDLAKNKAVGLVQGLKIKGCLAYFLKRFVSNNHTNIFN